MTANKQRLELNWIGKEHRPRLEPRILLEDPARSYHAAHRMGDQDLFDNRLIFGDNLLALKALEAEFAGKVKCVFIDPPYNTGSAFAHYDDGLEHSLWLSMMRNRLEIIRRLLSDDGSLWITIDDNEAHYLKVLCDEVFGRANFVATCVWEKDKGGCEMMLMYLSHTTTCTWSIAKSETCWSNTRNLLPRTETQLRSIQESRQRPKRSMASGRLRYREKWKRERRDFYPLSCHLDVQVIPPPGRVLGDMHQRRWRPRELMRTCLLWWGKTGTDSQSSNDI